MSHLHTHHWGYLYGMPATEANLKVEMQDFVVTEQLGYEPCGEGEHIYLWIEKVGLNTAYVAEHIARFAGVHLRAVTYAGRKDKFAITRQWIGVHVPGKQTFDWQQLNLDGLQVISATRHNKKLRTGVLKGNRFEIRLRSLSNEQDLERRLSEIAQTGVPNYYGPQRFGESRHGTGGGNLQLAEKMLEGEQIRNRNKRSMAISALRSWLFNQFVHYRMQKHHLNTLLDGDVCILAGSNSFFCASQHDANLEDRLKQRDIYLSAPLWGKGDLSSQKQALSFESDIASRHAQVCSTLADLGLKQERREIILYPEDLSWQQQDKDLLLAFTLPSGCFATSVIRELVNIRSTSIE